MPLQHVCSLFNSDVEDDSWTRANVECGNIKFTDIITWIQLRLCWKEIKYRSGMGAINAFKTLFKQSASGKKRSMLNLPVFLSGHLDKFLEVEPM